MPPVFRREPTLGLRWSSTGSPRERRRRLPLSIRRRALDAVEIDVRVHVLTDLLAREGAYAVILLALGAGPAAFLSQRFDAGSRIALAPILGFCLGTCVTTTVLEFVPTGSSYWLLVPLSLGSMGSRLGEPSRRDGRNPGLGGCPWATWSPCWPFAWPWSLR